MADIDAQVITDRINNVDLEMASHNQRLTEIHDEIAILQEEGTALHDLVVSKRGEKVGLEKLSADHFPK